MVRYCCRIDESHGNREIYYLELMEEQEVVDDRRSLGYDLSFEEDERSS